MAADLANEPLRVLNVGGADKNIPLPDCFRGWEHDLLDIDPAVSPDIVCDARELWRLPPSCYDAVYCSHNLEHYFRHEVPAVLRGMRMMLRKDGFLFLQVPDLQAVMRSAVERGLDLEDVLYESVSGPISVSDVIYGYHQALEKSGNDYYAHKTGFSENSLKKVLVEAGFPVVYCCCTNLEIVALAFRREPNRSQEELIGGIPDMNFR